MNNLLKYIKMGFGLPPLNTTDEELKFIMLKEKYATCNIHEFDSIPTNYTDGSEEFYKITTPQIRKPTRIFELNNADIFTTDIFTFFENELYKYSCFHIMTKEEIIKAHFAPPIGYGLIMVRFDKE